MHELPSGYAWMGTAKAGRLLIVRVRPDMDVVPTLVDACQREGILSGVIVSCIGSLKQAALVTVRPDAGAGRAYTEPIRVYSPLELISGQGFISLFPESGSNRIHMHVHFSDSTGRDLSGHLLPEGNLALFTVEVAILEVQGAQLRRVVDDTGYPQLAVAVEAREG